ncbi:MAG: hypothetical protein ACI8WB_001142 [Phenylobacterium sp.]|jgi:hypothetical protein
MSSPIGGFYLAAHNRKKAQQAELASRVPLTITLQLQVDSVMLLKQAQQTFIAEQSLFENYGAQVSVTAGLLSDELIQITCIVEQKTDKHREQQLLPLGTQIITLADGESITTLVEGNEHVRITVGCQLGTVTK